MRPAVISVAAALAGGDGAQLLSRSGEYRKWLRAGLLRAGAEMLAAGQARRRHMGPAADDEPARCPLGKRLAGPAGARGPLMAWTGWAIRPARSLCRQPPMQPVLGYRDCGGERHVVRDAVARALKTTVA